MSTEEETRAGATAVTGKPMAEYDAYVDMIAQVMANTLALATQRDFLSKLDRSVPLEEAVRHQARESIRWRFAFEIDRIEASRVPAPPAEDWEYEVNYPNAANPGIDGYRLRSAIKFATEPEAQGFAERVHNPVIRRRIKERKAGDWSLVPAVPVPGSDS